MNIPLPLIEFAAVIGVVLYLFTMSSSPLRREASPDKKVDEADSSNATAATDQSGPEDRRQG